MPCIRMNPKIFLWAYAIVSLILSPISPIRDAYGLDVKNLFKQSADSVVLIMSFDDNQQPLAIGSGFFVEDGEKLITNYHVIKGASFVRIKLTNGKVFEIKFILGVDYEHDLVVLKTPGVGKPLPLAERAPEIGQDVIAIGNPRGLEGTLSKGIVSGLRNEKGSIYYQVTAPISPGSSGGPVINENGEVLGVSTFFVSGGQNLNFAMPAAYIHKLLKNPQRTALNQITQDHRELQKKSVNENVKVIEPYMGGLRGNLEASILNLNNGAIKNIKLVAVFFSKSKGENPLHFMHIKIVETIPPSLSKRFTRRDSALVGHGQDYDNKGEWKVEFRVLDYEIMDQGGGGGPTIPAFE